MTDSENDAYELATMMMVIITIAGVNSFKSECGGMNCQEFPVFHMGVLLGAHQVLLSRSIQVMKDSTW